LVGNTLSQAKLAGAQRLALRNEMAFFYFYRGIVLQNIRPGLWSRRRKGTLFRDWAQLIERGRCGVEG